ncbi:phage holin family protein [Staphylococcus chromogenes]|nr:phage holin family protein [Staphylococcus chromogenes]
MSNGKGLYTAGDDAFAPRVNAIPLSDVDSRAAGQGSIGDLVSDATAQMSSLFRAEVELAKTEIAQSAKKGAIGGGFFGVAGTVALYSSFFFFFFLAELLDLWVQSWAAFLIVFLIMLALAGIFAFIGLKQIKKVKAPKKTIESVQEMKNLIPGKAQAKLESKQRGMYS